MDIISNYNNMVTVYYHRKCITGFKHEELVTGNSYNQYRVTNENIVCKVRHDRTPIMLKYDHLPIPNMVVEIVYVIDSSRCIEDPSLYDVHSNMFKKYTGPLPKELHHLRY